MKTKLLLAASLLALTATAQAMPPQPAKCPDVGSIRSVGLQSNIAQQDNNGQWVVGHMSSRYDTRQNWTFVVGRINADGPKDAYDKATASLPSLLFSQGPVAIPRMNRWGCQYTTSEGYVGVAVTPNLQGGITAIPQAIS